MYCDGVQASVSLFMVAIVSFCDSCNFAFHALSVGQLSEGAELVACVRCNNRALVSVF